MNSNMKNYDSAEMCPSEGEGFHLNSHSADWWGKFTVYSSLHEVVFLVVLSVAYERVHAIIEDRWIFLLLQYEQCCSYITGLRSV